jgi:FdhD protein
MDTGSKTIQYVKFNLDQWETVDAGVIVEQDVSLTVNGEIWLTLMCTPVDLDALALGFLYNEKVIDSIQDVSSYRVCPTFDNVDVWLNKSVEQPRTWRRTSGCTGGITSSIPDPEPTSAVVIPDGGASLSSGDVFQLLQQLFDSQSLYRQVGGVHTSILSDGKQIVSSADDIGRHNTLDKIAGYCLRDRIEVKQGILVTTGRISSEMLQKASRIGAQVVISRTSPSSMAIELAERQGITLIGYTHHDRFNVYTYPQRVTMP